MAGKVYVLTLAAFCAIAFADDDYHGHAGQGRTPAGAPQGGSYHQQKHLPQQGYQQQHQRDLTADGPRYHQHAGGRSGSQEYHDEPSMPVNYQFAYTVQAEGGAAGYGSGSQERSSGGSAAEFGHTEAFKDGRTEGKYFVGLPDGRLQTVVYHVEGDSGFVADVQYEGGDQSGEQYGKQVGYGKAGGSTRQAAYQGSSGYSSTHQGVSSSRKGLSTPVQKYGGALRGAGDSAEHGQGAAGGGGYATSTHQGQYPASTDQRYTRSRQY